MRIRAVIALGLLLSLGAVGCGGGNGNDGVATVNGKSKATTSAKPAGNQQEQALKFAQCMRRHGINMPDPKFDGKGGVSVSMPGGADKNKVDAAQQHCKQYLPNGGVPSKADPQALARGRKLAECMRANGVPKFPDPGPDGGIAIKAGPGLNPDDPTFKAAQNKCRPISGVGGTTSEQKGGE
jgi:hypothetical protein